MRPATLDADLLEERARAKLNLAREGELIFLDLPRGSGSR
jgi:cell division protein FtsB